MNDKHNVKHAFDSLEYEQTKEMSKLFMKSYLHLLQAYSTRDENNALFKEIMRSNEEQLIHNKKYLDNNAALKYCFLVQVHDRLENLKSLIISLEKVKGIDKVLIVFSHDLYDKDINKVIQDIKFAPVRIYAII
ncbi:hypothetical protein GJ496_000433 [Pomphorhynchus laevis]|nr:hypothetical protein GJ496_000433 [Pomphorhynchus laevis]